LLPFFLAPHPNPVLFLSPFRSLLPCFFLPSSVINHSYTTDRPQFRFLVRGSDVTSLNYNRKLL
jgi:hypothetical protein